MYVLIIKYDWFWSGNLFLLKAAFYAKKTGVFAESFSIVYGYKCNVIKLVLREKAISCFFNFFC